ncbi:MAG: hypothetical protein RIC16_15155 [Rhodospirillales bacterium]
MTERDELAFSRAVGEFNSEKRLRVRTRLPEIHNGQYSWDSIEGDIARSYNLLFPVDVDGRSKFLRDVGLVDFNRYVALEVRRSTRIWSNPEKKWAFDPPLLGWGEVIVGFPRGDDEMAKFAGKILRLVNKVTWKRTGFGLDACRWSQSDRDEARHGLGNGELVDPFEPIVLNKYYDNSLWDDRLTNQVMDGGQ